MATSKKLIVAIVLLGVLVGFAALIFPLLGRPDHIHDYTENIKYSTHENVAYYKQQCCHCDKYGPEKVLENSIIVTPETVQSVLDTNINGKTIVFAEYNFNDILELRPAKSDSTTRIYSSTGDTTFDESYALALNELVKDSDFRYHYTRTVENVTFVGTEGSFINNQFFANSNQTFAYDDSTSGEGLFYDAVREMDYTQSNQRGKHASHLTLINITFRNLNFVGSNKLICVDTVYQDSKVEKLTIENCTFRADLPTPSQAAINLSCKNDGNIIGATLTNNNFVGHYQGIKLAGIDTANISNNYFEKIIEDAIVVCGSSDANECFKGFVVVCFNTFENGSGLAINISNGVDATIRIESNLFSNFFNINENLLSVKNLGDNSTYSLVDNYNKSLAIENVFDATADCVV